MGTDDEDLANEKYLMLDILSIIIKLYPEPQPTLTLYHECKILSQSLLPRSLLP